MTRSNIAALLTTTVATRVFVGAQVAPRESKQALEAVNVRVLGTVLNKRTFPIPEKISRLL